MLYSLHGRSTAGTRPGLRLFPKAGGGTMILYFSIAALRSGDMCAGYTVSSLTGLFKATGGAGLLRTLAWAQADEDGIWVPEGICCEEWFGASMVTVI